MAIVKIGDKPVGSIVKIGVNGTQRNFIIVHHGLPSSMYDASCNGTWVLMEDCYEKRQWHSSDVNDYANSTIHSYLNSTFLNLIDANIRAQIKQAKIPYRPGSGTSQSVNSGANGLSAKIFLLSDREVGCTQSNVNSYIVNDGAKLSYFQDGNGTKEKIAKLNGSTTYWWLRSPYTSGATGAWGVYSQGSAGDAYCASTCGVRPALILPSTLLVSDDGTVKINTVPTTPSSINVPGSINGGSTITVSWGASTDAESNLAGYVVERSTNGGTSWAQIYKGTARSTTNAVAFGTATVTYRVKSYDSGGLQSGWRTSAQVPVINNTAPGTPGAIRVPTSINGGTTINISWNASTDAENNVGGYIVERSTNGGSSWEQIYQGAATSATNFVAFGTPSVMYRVKAYDNYGLQSGYRTSAQVTVINNTAPVTPASITVPITVFGGKTLTITWGGSADAENNLAGYSLERQVDGGSWTVIYTGVALSYVDTITKGWGSVTYRVRAYDTYDMQSGYATSATRTVNNNTAPTITCSAANGSSLGEKNSDFSVAYTVSDVDSGDTLTVTEAIDGVVLRSFGATSGTSYSFDVSGLTYMRVLNGTHTLTIAASDGKAETRYTLTFTKSVTSLMVTLAEPLPADAPITLCVISVTGSIPIDAAYTVEVTNNGTDDTPVWEDCTAEVKNGANHVFTNQTAANGPAFNFRVSAERGSSGLGGYITSVQGGFQ